MLLWDVLKPYILYIYLKNSQFCHFIFLALPLFFTSISTPKQPKPTPLHLNALFTEKSGYLSGYLSGTYPFFYILDKEHTHIIRPILY